MIIIGKYDRKRKFSLINWFQLLDLLLYNIIIIFTNWLVNLNNNYWKKKSSCYIKNKKIDLLI